MFLRMPRDLGLSSLKFCTCLSTLLSPEGDHAADAQSKPKKKKKKSKKRRKKTKAEAAEERPVDVDESHVITEDDDEEGDNGPAASRASVGAESTMGQNQVILRHQ